MDLKILVVMVVLGSFWGAFASAAETPCSGIDRALPGQAPAVTKAIARQMGVSKVQILESFREGRWQILYVNNYVADEAFLFYAGDPTARKYISLWAGAAMPSEQASILRWTETNAPGIPYALAACFAWHVTQDRDQ